MMDIIHGLDPIVFYVASGLGYVFLGGMTYELMGGGSLGREERQIGCVFWPVTWVCWTIYQVAMAGPRLVRMFRAKKMGRDLPRAEVVRPSTTEW